MGAASRSRPLPFPFAGALGRVSVVKRDRKGVLSMVDRQIRLGNARAAVARWEHYVVRAIMAGDRAREDYGNIRIVNARKRLKRLLRP